MAVVEKTIIAGGGGDYTTLASWESATDLNGGADIWKGVISDNSAYDEVFTINVDGTSATSYVWLTTAGANRHAGVWDTGKARVDYSGSSNQAVQIAGDWVRVDWMQIARLSGYGSSDEGIRVSKADDILIDYCIIWCNDDGATGGMDGILFKSAAITGSVSNCVIYGWSRSGIGINQSGSVTPYDHTINVDHCAATESNTGASSSANVVFRNQWGDTIVNMYNTWFNGPAGAAGDDLRIDDGDTPETDTITVNGSHNLFDDVYYDGGGTTTENWTDNITPTDTVDDTAPATSGVYVTDYSYPTSLDLTPVVHANNALLGAGTNRIGSESDPRQDFSIDIAGNPRSATITDIGPFASALDLAETIDDGGTEADSVTASMDHARTVADGGTEADSATASLDRARAITDSGTAGDTVVVSLGHVHSEADGGTASDTATVSLGHARSEADGGIEADSATTSMELAHSEADGGIEADSATTSMELAYSEADGGTEADSATTSMELASSEADSGSALDGSTANLGFDRAEADSGTAADSPAATLGLAHSIADSGTVGETVATSMELARSEVDGGTEADSA
ncbi:MAG: hypothetical protein GY925_03315, partial [Actinomycetia bacterium]|nr:hypothetical protein [Actinomycetes bacterium]